MDLQQTYREIAQVAESIALEAGEQLMQYFRSEKLQVSVKLNESDIVTVADKASESVILKRLAETYPSHSILSEESGMLEQAQSDWLWVIDPLDGTTNFSEGLPVFSVSIGLKHNGVTVVGVVHNPYLKETFTAVKGDGAKLNGKPIKCRENKLIERAVICTGFPVDKDVNPDNNLDNLSRVLPHVRGIRRYGSAALDLSYVGAGFLDGYWELNLHEWDVCAGMLIVAEAGGLVERFRENRNICVVAGSQPIFPQLRALVK